MMHVKQKGSSRLKTGKGTGENCLNVLLFQHIIQAITERNNGIHRFRQLPFLHILPYPAHTALPQEPAALRVLLQLFLCHRQHVGREVNARHMIP
ncbi:hypothetical protein D3C75_1197570 [compost metagenome]